MPLRVISPPAVSSIEIMSALTAASSLINNKWVPSPASISKSPLMLPNSPVSMSVVSPIANAAFDETNMSSSPPFSSSEVVADVPVILTVSFPSPVLMFNTLVLKYAMLGSLRVTDIEPLKSSLVITLSGLMTRSLYSPNICMRKVSICLVTRKFEVCGFDPSRLFGFSMKSRALCTSSELAS